MLLLIRSDGRVGGGGHNPDQGSGSQRYQHLTGRRAGVGAIQRRCACARCRKKCLPPQQQPRKDSLSKNALFALPTKTSTYCTFCTKQRTSNELMAKHSHTPICFSRFGAIIVQFAVICPIYACVSFHCDLAFRFCRRRRWWH